MSLSSVRPSVMRRWDPQITEPRAIAAVVATAIRGSERSPGPGPVGTCSNVSSRPRSTGKRVRTLLMSMPSTNARAISRGAGDWWCMRWLIASKSNVGAAQAAGSRTPLPSSMASAGRASFEPKCR
jgi:hypothetical protein